jgi:hypothetical protein
MRLTSEILARFVGGQAEIQNSEENYVFRGEIEAIVIEEDELKIKFKWLGNSPLRQIKWTKSTKLDYAISLAVCGAHDIGAGSEGGGSRIRIDAQIVGEIIALFPPDGSKLDPAKIEGLEIAA